MQRPVTDLPKAHLHLHFTGSMRVETVRDLADKHHLHLPDALTTGYPPQPECARPTWLVPFPAPV